MQPHDLAERLDCQPDIESDQKVVQQGIITSLFGGVGSAPAAATMVYVLFREHIRLRVRVQVSLLALFDKPTMAWLASAMSSQERLGCGSTFRKRNM